MSVIISGITHLIFGSHSNWFGCFYVTYLNNQFPNKLLIRPHPNEMLKGGLEKDSSSPIAMIDRDFLLPCMLGPVEKDENQSLPRAGFPSPILL